LWRGDGGRNVAGMGCRAVALAVCAALVAIGCGAGTTKRAAPRAEPRLTARLARVLDARLSEKVAETGIPGASAAIVFADGRVWSGAAGDAVSAPRQPMTPRTSLPFDSVTKVATAALALRLVERGLLGLDDPVRRWYPGWSGDRRATVRDLLGHTAGAKNPRDAFFDRLLRHPRRVATAQQLIAATPRPGPRTSEAEYSNTGFVIAGLIVERAAGESLAAAMRRELFSQPGGDGLALQPAEQPRAPRAHSYWYPRGLSNPVDASDQSPILPFRAWASMAAAAGALAGDVPSLARWGHQLLGGHILKPSSLTAMTRFRSGGPWQGYGLGLARDTIDGREMWGHTGDGLGSHTDFWHLPRERLTVVIAWNDAAIDGGILPALLRPALASR
jgi:D-alanyl-D-alanine carboxypeptidase